MLEKRMYGLVPYNVSEIQKGIQFGHAVVEYANENFNDEDYQEWSNKWKTFIILNGGTSNHTHDRYGIVEDYVGSMELHLEEFQNNGIKVSTFYEPDLNDMLSGIVFIVDERVFNKKDYPDFKDWVMDNYGDLLKGVSPLTSNYKLTEMIKNSDSKFDRDIYQKWADLVGGEKNVFLREYLKQFRLA